jgi:hypothetical protein
MPDSSADNLGRQDGDIKTSASATPGGESPTLRFLRLVAVIGTGLVLLSKAASLAWMKPNQGLGFLVLILAAVGVGLTCVLVLPAAARRLRRHPDLLVPLGLYLTAEAVLSMLLAIPVVSAVFSPSWNLKILAFSSSLSLNFLIQVALAVTYAGWTTILMVQAVRQDRVDPMAALSAWPAWFWRVLGAEAIGWCVLFVCLTLAIALGAVVLPLALLLIGALSLFWNLLTAALLPVVVGERSPFVETVRKALRVSWERMGRWWFPVVVQMVLLGWVTLLYVSYTASPRPGYHRTNTKSDVSVNGFWMGGYENSCRWHTKLMAAVETDPMPLVEFLLGVLFAILAIVVKLRITADLYGSDIAQAGPEQDGASDGLRFL